jgi:hypothetical protein
MIVPACRKSLETKDSLKANFSKIELEMGNQVRIRMYSKNQ